MAEALKKQGQELQGNGRYEDAVKSYQQAVSLYRTAEQEEYQVEAALLYTEMGLLNWDTNQLQEAEESYQAALDIYRKIAASNKKYLPDEAVASYNMGRFYQETRDEDVNDYLREAFELARECKDYNEQCRDIYENLEDEPLYEKTSEKEREEDKEEQSDMEEDTEINISSDTEIGDTGETEEKQTDKESAGGWLKKLFGRKK
jgi:tetratricopeptide (TPR) repeat protein